MRMENRMVWVFAILIVITFRESLTAEPNNACQYQCEIKQNVTDVLWILKFNGQTEMLSRCYVETQRCDQMLDDCTIATINSTSSLLSISANLEQQRGGQVGYAELINGMGGEIRFDAKRNPISMECSSLTQTTGKFPSNQQTSVFTDSPIETNPLDAWQYQCEINENVTDVLWILRLDNDIETLSRCYIGSHSCGQRQEECAIATITSTSSVLNISASLVAENFGRVGYAEIINGLRGEIRYDAKRSPIKMVCSPLNQTTGKFPSNQQTSAFTDSPIETDPLGAWQYQYEIKDNVSDVLWILRLDNDTELLSRCYIGSQNCEQRQEECAIATTNRTSSVLNISASLVTENFGRVGYAVVINGMRGGIRYDAKRIPIKMECSPFTQTTRMFPSNQQTSAFTDSPIETNPVDAWQYQCEISENVTDVLWILRVGNDTETLSRCYIGSQNCDQRIEECAIATINSTSSVLKISASLMTEKVGRVGYAERINGLRGEIRYDAKRSPIKWACSPLTETTGKFP